MNTKTRTAKAPLMICGRGFRKSDKALVWMVESQSETNRWHQVTQLANGQLTCDCKAAQYNRPTCAHRDAVRTLLTIEEAEFQASQPPTLTTAPAPVTRTDDERATAMLYRSNAAFSIFKA